ncbi:hypothetical protein VM57_08215 [Stenotrophomonas maltophilia]|uniref:Uncharacterized protein n=1 Tax=Stenotrophomonas maltophilia TaxID=40324 RepID=A0A0F5ZNS4_STEMA|nr:hypothetical protein VM57_08215 [Stenotrophomonas maltophilia]
MQSDGRYFPGGRSAANAYITINGEVVSNDSYIDWRQSTSAQQHSFNVIGAKYLPAGHHTVNLAGQAIGSAVNSAPPATFRAHHICRLGNQQQPSE